MFHVIKHTPKIDLNYFKALLGWCLRNGLLTFTGLTKILNLFFVVCFQGNKVKTISSILLILFFIKLRFKTEGYSLLNILKV